MIQMENPHQFEKHELLDYIREKFKINSDKDLAIALNLKRSYISKVRNGTMKVTPTLILHVHDATDMPIRQIKQIAGVTDSLWRKRQIESRV